MPSSVDRSAVSTVGLDAVPVVQFRRLVPQPLRRRGRPAPGRGRPGEPPGEGRADARRGSRNQCSRHTRHAIRAGQPPGAGGPCDAASGWSASPAASTRGSSSGSRVRARKRKPPSPRGRGGARSRISSPARSRPARSPAGTRPGAACPVNRLTQPRSPSQPANVRQGMRARVHLQHQRPGRPASARRSRAPLTSTPRVVRFSPKTPPGSSRPSSALPAVQVLPGEGVDGLVVAAVVAQVADGVAASPLPPTPLGPGAATPPARRPGACRCR